MRDGPIRCVQIGAHSLAQGPVSTTPVNPADHHPMTVRIGESSTATGLPVPSLRKEQP